MAVTDAKSLNALGLMYGGQTAPQWQVMKLALLQQILSAINPMAATDPTSLLAAGNQYCNFDPTSRQVMELALLGQIANSTFPPGGVGFVFRGTTAQRNATTPAQSTAIWILTDSFPPNQLSIWTGSAWI